jgi:crossover junction endodeoxyribonuclease RuvC
MILCGIDPGTRVVGIGFVADERPRRLIVAEAIRLDARTTLPQRLCVIERRLGELLAQHRPDCVAIERVFQGRNVASLIGLGEGRGVALLAAAKAGLPIFEYTPAEVKKTITGNGAATKEQVAGWVRAELRDVSKTALRDLTDALAIALCHAERGRLARLTAASATAGAAVGASPLLSRIVRRARRGRSR